MTPAQLRQWATAQSLPDAWFVAFDGEENCRPGPLPLVAVVAMAKENGAIAKVAHEAHFNHGKPDWVDLEEDVPAGPSFEIRLQNYISQGWKVTSDGPAGVQLEMPKQLSTAGKFCLVLGLVGLLLAGLGIILLIFAAVDYFILAKPPTMFLPRR